MRNNWESKTIKVKDLEEKIRKGEIAVPTYQRGIVWNDEQRESLIDSIKKGYPFGALVMYRYDDQNKPMLLIDGLQRSTALFKFVNNPSEYFGSMDIKDDDMINICNVIGLSDPSEDVVRGIKKKIVEWTNHLSGSTSIINMDIYQCAQFIANEIKGPNSDPSNFQFISDIKTAIEPTFNSYKDICNNIIERGIPYIEITGDEDGLSDIFFRINDRGTKLSKEDKFAATWTNRSVKITNDKLIEFVNIVSNRYDKIQSEGAKIYMYDHQDFIDKKELDVFELCFAFGKYITTNYPELFGKPKDLIKPESIGFVLLNACLLESKESLYRMNSSLFQRFPDDSDINTFITKIISVIKYVDVLLAPVLKFKSNKRICKKPLHTDFQIVSIVASIFKMKHVEETVPNEYTYILSSTTNNWSNCDILLRKNLIKRYLLDSLNNVWAGHGDHTLDTIISDSKNDYYTSEIPSLSLENSLNNWYENYKFNNKESSENDIKPSSDIDRIIMNIIYSNTLSAFNQLSSDKYDIEHLYTKKLAERTMNRLHGQLRLPISSIGNLCLLPEYTNRKKKDKIIYDDDEYTDKIGNTITIKQLEDNYTFTNKEGLIWANDTSLSADDVKSKYYDFIDKRFEKIKSKLIEILYPNN